MARAWAVGVAAALIAVLLYESALAWVSIMGPAILPPLFLLLSYVVIGAATGHAAVSLTGGPNRAWPAVVVVAVVGAVLIGWGRNAELLHPAMAALPAALGGGACTAVGGWLGLVLPNAYRSAAPSSVLAQLKTVELRARPSARPVSDGGRHHQRRAPVTEPADGPDILEFGS
ncbi:hypothetical protein [Cryptosporangium aurantiacum]|uniref:Uncharacterized protein n=1 Tax=Cryptosporangium aurantiacum TaxID=134849 RepID=A0A1M7RCJ3_9ACTN|nr:hypothetical protein [Cryptosporangium aurantiacum]SHN44003.1 hypothetical protein SAMN05443668_11011 [Cryptosporangium aurantiacum]